VLFLLLLMTMTTTTTASTTYRGLSFQRSCEQSPGFKLSHTYSAVNVAARSDQLRWRTVCTDCTWVCTNFKKI